MTYWVSRAVWRNFLMYYGTSFTKKYYLKQFKSKCLCTTLCSFSGSSLQFCSSSDVTSPADSVDKSIELIKYSQKTFMNDSLYNYRLSAIMKTEFLVSKLKTSVKIKVIWTLTWEIHVVTKNSINVSYTHHQ